MVRVIHKAWEWRGELLHTSGIWAWVLWNRTEIPQTAMLRDLDFEPGSEPAALQVVCNGCGRKGCDCPGNIQAFGWTAADVLKREG